MRSKKFMIRTDLEGVSGVVSYSQVEPGKPEYAETRENFMREILALISGLKTGGAEEIAIYDEHWFGRNLQISRLPGGVTSYCGKPPYREDWAGGLDSTFCGLILHGFHSRAGSGHLLHHSYEPDIAHIELNGRAIGEIGLEAAIAGDFGVPLVLITADSGGIEEAQELFPQIECVATKQSQAADGAECLPLGDVLDLIENAASRVARNLPPVSPFRLDAPIELAIDLKDGPFLAALRARARSSFVSEHRIVLHSKSVTAAWSHYWNLKLSSLEDVAHANTSH
jgi:D-amino peptidase